jgi:hypothetical protein
MDFTLETAISELRKAVPACPIDYEWEQDNLSYLAFGDFARFNPYDRSIPALWPSGPGRLKLQEYNLQYYDSIKNLNKSRRILFSSS